MRDISTKADGTGDTLTAGDFNSFNDELENAVKSAGFTLDPAAGPDTNLDMLAQTMAIYGGSSYEETGAVNAYAISRHDLLKTAIAYFDGMVVLFKATNSNTGASTLNVSSLGIKSIVKGSGSALTANDIVLDRYTIATYNAAIDKFEITDFSDKDLAETLTNKTISGDDNTITEVDSIKDVNGDLADGYESRVFEIGSWNMDTLFTKILTVSGIVETKVISMSVSIISDINVVHPLNFAGDVGNPSTHWDVNGMFYTAGDDIILERRTGGFFDNGNFDGTQNRGFVTILQKV